MTIGDLQNKIWPFVLDDGKHNALYDMPVTFRIVKNRDLDDSISIPWLSSFLKDYIDEEVDFIFPESPKMLTVGIKVDVESKEKA